MINGKMNYRQMMGITAIVISEEISLHDFRPIIKGPGSNAAPLNLKRK